MGRCMKKVENHWNRLCKLTSMASRSKGASSKLWYA